MMTPRQRVLEAERDFLEALKKRSAPLVTDALRSALSTAELVNAPTIAMRGHKGFAERHPMLFQNLVGMVRHELDVGAKAEDIVRELRSLLEDYHLPLFEPDVQHA